MADKKIWKGPKDLEKHLVKIDLIDEAEDNENEHPAHQIKLLSEVLAATGQQRPLNVLATEDGRFVTNTGHAVIRAAKLAGWTHLALIKFDGTEDEAAAYRVADNMLGRLSTMNPIKVGKTAVKLESKLPGFDASILGMEPQKLKKITEALKATSPPPDPSAPSGGFGVGGGPSSDDSSGDENGGSKGKDTTLRYELFFESEEDRERWFNFLRSTRERYPDVTAPASRVLKFIEEGLKPVADAVEITEGRIADGYFVLAFETGDEAEEFEGMADWLSKHYGTEKSTQAILALFREATSGDDEEEEEQGGKGD